VGIDLNAFVAHYPVKLTWPEADVYHLSVQTYASVLMSAPPPGPVVVTVHDIIPYVVRHDSRLTVYRHPIHRLFDLLAMRGLARADAIAADSGWTKQTLVQNLAMPAERISVVPLGVDHRQYRPSEVPASFRSRYELPECHRYVMYVGSEDPRKNLEALWRAFAIALQADPGLRLLKVGPAHSQLERRRLVSLADQLGVGGAVRFLDYVPEEDLPLLYNAASVCVVPSHYEGFGLPVLEAMACGTPVVCSSAASLPEVAGEAAVLVPGADGVRLAEAIGGVLANSVRRTACRERGFRQAERFRWETTASRMVGVYREAIDLYHRPVHAS